MIKSHATMTTKSPFIKQHKHRMPLVVTIRGQGPATGKSTLQLHLAQFLSEYGHDVFLSEDENRIETTLKYYPESADNPEPLTVCLHVSDEDSKELLNKFMLVKVSPDKREKPSLLQKLLSVFNSTSKGGE